MIVLVGNTKGGVGKTTLAINLAAARARAGSKVWLVDGDRQQTALLAMTIRSENGTTPPIACSLYPDGASLREQVKQQAGGYDDVIIDAGGRDSTSLRAALTLADVLVAPYAPGSFDVWALTDLDGLVAEAQALRDGLHAYAVLNKAKPQVTSQDNADAAAAIEDVEHLDYLPTPLVSRTAFGNAAAVGVSVHDAPRADPKAVAELDRLTAAIFNQQGER